MAGSPGSPPRSVSAFSSPRGPSPEGPGRRGILTVLRPRPLGRRRTGTGGTTGSATFEYVGALSLVLTLLVIVGVAFAGQRPAVESGVRAVVCAVLGGDACGGPGSGGGAPGRAGPVVAGPGGDPGIPAAEDAVPGDGPAADAVGPAADGSGTPDGSGDSGSEDADAGAPESTDIAATTSGPPAPGPWCSGARDCLGRVGGQVGSGLVNFGRGALDEVVGVWNLANNPSQIVDAARYILENPGDAARQMVWDDESADMWRSGNIGGAIGRTAWNVGSWLIPGYNFGKAGGLFGDAGRIARLGGDLGRVVDDVAGLSRRAQEALARGDVTQATDAAAAAQRRVDDLEGRARRSGCLSAGRAESVVVLAAGVGGGAGAPVAVAGPAVLAAGCGDTLGALGEARRHADDAARSARWAQGLDDLGSARRDLGLPPPGRGSPTLSRLDVEGQQPIYGISAHGQDVTLRVNPISRTHAETDALQQLANRGGGQGGRATMYIDHPNGMCAGCGRNGAVRSMARQAGLSEITVVWPGGSRVIVP